MPLSLLLRHHKAILGGTKHCVCLKETYTSFRQMIQRCTNKTTISTRITEGGDLYQRTMA